MSPVLAFLQMPGLGEWLVIGLIGLLLFGKRLPEVGKSLGKGIVEFKKGLKGVEDEITTAADEQPRVEQPRNAALPTGGYKFDPYTGKPLVEESAEKAAPRFDPYTGKPVPDAPATSERA